MDHVLADAFAEKVQDLATELGVPGVAAGVLFEGQEHYGFAGVTSVENPLEVNADTLFQFGSTGKTFTATAIMILVEQGSVRLDEPVRTYVPHLRLKDPDVAARVSVLQLLNHSAGWDGDLFDDTGDGDDALEKYVALMADIEQVSPLGSTISYNNAALSLAGLVIANVTGVTYEEAIATLVLEPLGLTQTYFTPGPVLTRRFAVGHQLAEGSSQPAVARPLFGARSSAPAGSTATSTAHDQLAWARFHLGDGTSGRNRLLSAATLKSMQEPSLQMPAGALGDAIGISWMLKDTGGVLTVRHGGTTHGQHSSFVMVPAHDFAVISMTNCGPNGAQLNDELTAWALEHFLGVVDAEPEVAVLDEEALGVYVGVYDTIAFRVHVTADDGRLAATLDLKPEAVAMLVEAGQDPAEQEQPIPLGIIVDRPDQYVVPAGASKGMIGHFTRSATGTVEGIHLGGRLATRLASGQESAAGIRTRS